MKRILAAVDESPMAAKVVCDAGSLAKSHEATVSVCHVLPDEEALKMLMGHSTKGSKHPFTWTQPEEKAFEIAKRAAEGLKEFGVAYDVYGETGDVACSILKLADTLKVEMIVIGFHGLHGLDKMKALGSVSRQVMENASCPVLLVVPD